MDVAAGGVRPFVCWLIELCYQRSGQRHAGRVGGAQDKRVTSCLGQHGGFKSGICLACCGCSTAGGTRVKQALQYRNQIGGQSILEGNDFNASGVGHIECGNDACQTLQVVGVIGNDQGIGAGVHIEGVVGADEGAQNRYQIVGTLMVQLKNLCNDLTIRGRHRACRHAATLQLGICLRNHQIQTCRLDQRKTLRAQLGCKQSERLRRGHRHIAGQGDGALDPGVDHYIVARQGGQGFGHCVNLGIDEVQCDGFW